MSKSHEDARAAAEFRRAILPAKRAADDLLGHLGRVLTAVAETSKRHARNASAAEPTLTEIGSAIHGAMHVRGSLIRTHVTAHEAARIVFPNLQYGDIFYTEPMPKQVVSQQPVLA